MKKLLYTLFVIFLFGIPVSYTLRIPFFQFTSKANYRLSHNKNLDFISIQGQSIVFGSQSESMPFKDYIDYDSSGYFVNYDKMGELISVFFKKNKIFEWKNKSNYPRLAIPYLILFSSDFSKAEIFHIKKGFANPVKTIRTKKMITSWASSPDGNYIILGDLGGNFYIYSHNNKKYESRSLNLSRINYVKGVSIDNEGSFVLTGSLYPEVLAMGQMGEKTLEAFGIPSTGRSRKIIDTFLHYKIIEGNNEYYLLSEQDNKMIRHRNSFKYFKAFEYQSGDYIYTMVLTRNNNENCLDVFINSRYFYSVRFMSFMLPVFKERKNASPLLFWDKGVLEI